MTFPFFAYIDPTAGGMLLQLLLGGLAALLLVIQLFWRRILRLFGIRREKPAPTQDGDSKPQVDSGGTENSPAPPKDPA